jgi:tetratricopeptide (TPR) repeat protein
MTDAAAGQVITFYSYKGGTGRTMALANVAWILAANGKRVLVADWDLESPGLHRFFKPFLDADKVRGSTGIIEIIRSYEWETTRNPNRPERWHEELAKVGRHTFSLDWRFPGGGALDFLSAGLQNQDYAVAVSGLDWETFYNRLGGAQFFDALRADMKRNYDYTLIDSRTGLSDVAEICTIHLPDTLVDCFTLSDQGIDGAAEVARKVESQYSARTPRQRPIRVLPVPMRVDQAENDKANAGRLVARGQFRGLPTGMSDEDRRRYWAAVEVPYQTYYAYEEMLATFGDDPGSPRLLLSAYERLTGYVTRDEVTTLPLMDESVRLRTVSRFTRKAPEHVDEEIVLRYAPVDQVWAEWIEWVLTSAGVRVIDPQVTGSVPDSDSARTLAIVSSSRGNLPPLDLPGSRPPIAVYVADVRPLPGLPGASSTSTVGLDEQTAASHILRLVGRTVPVAGDDLPAAARYPRLEPSVFNVPVRNARFTGRERELQQLRAQLKAGRSAVVLPVTLRGMGGVGKTQLAMEYAHRFKSAYEIVWWIRAEQPEFIDAQLSDLGARMGVTPGPTAAETAQVTLDELKQTDRWLVIFDNAEDVEAVDRWRPQGNGHVLITSRNEEWENRTTTLPIDVFKRHESVAHLRRRVPALTDPEAEQIAEALGDLPLALSNAAGWLSDTGTPVREYLRQVEVEGSVEEAWRRTWRLSLDRLRSSPGAYRLLQLCSVMAPDIALDLIYSDEMAAAIAPYDPSVAERQLLAGMVQRINRLALLKHDTQARQIQVHRVIQAVVRDRMSELDLHDARHQVHLVLARSRPGGEVDDPDNWPRLRTLWPHLRVSQAVDCRDELVRQLLIDRVRYLWRRGDLAQGVEFGRDIESRWVSRLENEPEFAPDTPQGKALYRQLLHLRFNTANHLWSQGRFDEALKIDQEVHARQRELYGPEHPHTLMTADSMGSNLRGLGRYREALELDRATHATWSRVFGEDYRRTLFSANNLATTYRLVGEFRSAMQLDQEVYERRRQGMGPRDLYTLHSAQQLARDLREAGEYERSLALLRDVHTTLRNDDRLGPEALETLSAQANLAVSLRSVGHGRQAARLLDETYQRMLDRFGPSNEYTLACQLSLAATLVVIGETERATREMSAVTEAYRQSLGETHPHTLVCLNNLSAAMRVAGDVQQARELAATTAEQLSKTLGADHPYALASGMNLAICLADVGEVEQSRDLLQSVATRMAGTLGPDHPDTLSCQTHLAIVLRRLGEPNAAATYVQATERIGKALGVDHPIVVALREGRMMYRVLDPNPY